MLGDTPQPGETPRSEGDPWSFADPDAAWWRGETDRPSRPRHPRRRPPSATKDQESSGGTGVLEPPGTKTHTGEAADAHAAAAQDVAEALDPTASPRPTTPAAELTAPATAAALLPPVENPPLEAPPSAAPAPVVASASPPAEAVARFVAVERDHDRPDPHRYDPLRPPAGYTPKRTAAGTLPSAETAAEQPGAAVGQQPDIAITQPSTGSAAQAAAAVVEQPPAAAEPASAGAEAGSPAADAATAPPAAEAGPSGARAPGTVTPPPADQDVMVLPEPSARNRPTVPLEPGAAPARPPVVRRPRQGGAHVRPTEPLPPPTGSPATDARLERLENSPFWHDRVDDTIEVMPEEPRRLPGRPRHSRRSAGLPLSAQVSLVALGLVAAFFAWVSAEPFWLAVGHGDLGHATTTVCTGTGVTQRCAGQFTAEDGSYTIARVTLLGVEGTGRQPGAVTPAKMVSPDSQQAYLGGTGALLQLRWLLGFALVLLCGYAIAGVTRARQLPSARARRAAILLSLAGPLALLAGFLAAAY
ncbi:hypothetical protein [Actinoplanes sp. NPDC048796]|uniref:hypothetical protein n=1 Tax=Actinoplanes sp. NPDC048796 TaxID=3155640 RepID=UPI0033FA6D9A